MGRPCTILLAALLAVVTATGCGDHAERFRPLEVGAPAPAYAVRVLGGDSVALGAPGPVTLVHLWATWCTSCAEEFPDLEALQRDYGPRGLRIVAVSVDQGSDDPVRAFAREHGATFVIGRDRTNGIQMAYQTIGLPESYLVGRDGRLLWRQIGAMPRGAAPARAAIERALAE